MNGANETKSVSVKLKAQQGNQQEMQQEKDGGQLVKVLDGNKEESQAVLKGMRYSPIQKGQAAT